MSSLGTLAVLPLEIRTIVYTQLFRSTTVPFNITADLGEAEEAYEPPKQYCPLNKRLAILVASKQTYFEASPLVREYVIARLTNCSLPPHIACNAEVFARHNPTAARIQHVVVSLLGLRQLAYIVSSYRPTILLAQMFPALKSIVVVEEEEYTASLSTTYNEKILALFGGGLDAIKSKVGSKSRGWLAYMETLDRTEVAAELGEGLYRMTPLIMRDGWKHHVNVCMEMALTPRKASRWEIGDRWYVETEIIRRKDMAL